MIHENYKDDPSEFTDRLRAMGLDKELGMPIKGEGIPVIRSPGEKGWSGISLAWMSHGYEVSLTPLQTLAFYNAIANDGELVRPRLIKEVREWNRTVAHFDKEVLNPAICSQQTVQKVQQLLRNVVASPDGTGHGLESPFLSLAGKTGTAQKNYASKDPDKLGYISTFAGYFPADDPQYSCIVVIHEPDKSVGYYGADVAGPVFNSVASKITSNKPVETRLENLAVASSGLDQEYSGYYTLAQQQFMEVPDLEGMSGMDAVSLLENLGVEVEIRGNGKVKKQSVSKGTDLKGVTKIILELS
jgi:cell division protein FtsI (penicillin-binding protein 3)